MNLFRRSRESSFRTVVLGLDGVPHSLIQRLVQEGRMPNLSALLDRGSLLPMSSVLPTVSSVAWASIVSGCNPGKHNIFGFIDRLPRTHEMFIPNARHLKAKTWVELFSGMGRRVFSMGVPSTYPPKAVNGVLISGFLAPSLEKATYPLQVAGELASRGYVIDIDAWEAHEDKQKFLDSVFQALDRRCDAMFHYLGQGGWDLFVAHLIDTDRLHHFLWAEAESGHEVYSPWFHRFYERVDGAIGELASRAGEETLLVILSDHGFCALKQEVHLNTWLRQAGYLQFANREPKQLLDLAPSTRCYSLLPGRFYICLRGRERNGCVSPGTEYEALRREIAEGLMAIRDPGGGGKAIEKVFMREELYSGDAYEQAPDLVAMPARGYDLKGGFDRDVLMERGPVSGTHTFDDAMLFVNRDVARSRDVTVLDVMPTVLKAMGMAIPDDVDGTPLRLDDKA